MSNELYLGQPPIDNTAWIKKYAIPFHFECLEDGHIQLNRMAISPPKISLQYSFDNKTWQDWDHLTGTDVIAGQKFYLKSKTDTGYFNKSTGYKFYFSATNKVNVAGNIMSLLYNNFVSKLTSIKESYTDVVDNGSAFCYLFQNCTTLIDASKLVLPVVVTPFNAYYYGMFRSCTSLVKAPEELPAITMTFNTYNMMFANCTSLTTAPKIYVTNFLLTSSNRKLFMNTMFNNCLAITELHYSKALQNNTFFASIPNSPWFGATNATVYYDL